MVVRWKLEMKSAQDAFSGNRIVLLRPVHFEPVGRKQMLVEGLDEATARVFTVVRVDFVHPGHVCRCDVHE